MADLLHLELVAADRVVWSGDATFVAARTTDGDIGVLPNHAPVLSVMVDGVVEVVTESDERWSAAVDRGFLSVANNRVSILSETVELASDIDVEQARQQLDEAEAADDGEDESDAKAEAVRWAQARVRAAETAR
ncbi:MAG: F0F1 ATP synthase subunit epsilon [Nocardioidaceae bacterium]